MVKHNITIEDSSPLISYSGTWSDPSTTALDIGFYSGYTFPSFHEANVGKLDFIFNGSAIYVYGTLFPAGGPYSAEADLRNVAGPSGMGVPGMPPIGSLSSVSLETIYHHLLFSHQGFNPSLAEGTIFSGRPIMFGLHLDINSRFILDYIVVESEIGGEDASSVRSITLDDTSRAFSYVSGTWDTSVDPTAPLFKYLENGTEHYTSDTGARVKIEFQGSGIEVHGSWQSGGYTLQFDDLPTLSVASSSPVPYDTGRPRELLCFFDGLPERNHTLILTYVGSTAWGNPQYFHVDYAIISTADTSNVDGLVHNDASVSPSSSINLPTSASSGPSPSTAFSSSANLRSSSTSVIIGSVVGGTVFVIILLGVLFWYLRRRVRSSGKPTPVTDLLEDGSVESDPAFDHGIPPPAPYPTDMTSDTGSARKMSILSDSFLPSGPVQGHASGSYTPTADRSGSVMSMASPSSASVLDPRAAPSIQKPNASSAFLPTELPISLIPVNDRDAGVSLLRAGASGPLLPPQYDPSWTSDPHVDE